MPVRVEKDLRNVKTQQALDDAMLTLLGSQKFAKITVSDLCEGAVISRATFYAHYLDKYDFFKYWLMIYLLEHINVSGSYERIEKIVNKFVSENKIIIKNIVCDANSETLDILSDVILSALKMDIMKNGDSKTHTKYAVFSNMIAGGIIHYCLWLVKNNFPPDVDPMNVNLFYIIENLRKMIN